MKKKQLKVIASKIAEAEKIVNSDAGQDKKDYAKKTIMYYSNMVDSFEELILLDDLIQKELKKS